MPDNKDNLETNDFGIMDTMNLGAGDAQLYNDLLAPDTPINDPDDIQDINNGTVDIKTPIPQKKAPKVKNPLEADDNDDDTDPPPQKDYLADYLASDGDDSSDNNDDDDKVPDKKKDKAPVDNVDDNNEGGDDNDEPNTFVALSKDLFKLGVFTTEEGEEDSPVTDAQGFLDRFNVEKKKGAIETIDNFIGQFGEDYRAAFDAIYVKGVDPKEYFGIYNNVVNFAELDMTEEDNQVTVIRQGLIDQGYEPNEITSEIERIKNYGDLETVSAKMHKVIIKKEAQKLSEITAKAEEKLQQKNAIKSQYIQNVQTVLQDKIKAKEFDGIPFNSKIATELHDFLLVDKYKTASGETLTDFDRVILELKRPENHTKKVKVALLLKLLEKDPTLSTIQKSGVSKQSTKLFDEVARQTSKGRSSSNSQVTKPGQSWFVHD